MPEPGPPGSLAEIMNSSDFVALIHLVGFLTGVALYGMLAVMAWRGTRRDQLLRLQCR